MKLLAIFLIFNLVSFALGYFKSKKERNRLMQELAFAIFTAKMKDKQLRLVKEGVVKL